MQLSYDNLLYNLALESMDLLLQQRPVSSDFSNKKQQQRTDEDIAMIEEDIEVAFLLRNRKRRIINTPSHTQPNKRGKYTKRKLYFTNPETGVRSIMTYDYSIWWQSYIINP